MDPQGTKAELSNKTAILSDHRSSAHSSSSTAFGSGLSVPGTCGHCSCKDCSVKDLYEIWVMGNRYKIFLLTFTHRQKELWLKVHLMYMVTLVLWQQFHAQNSLGFSLLRATTPLWDKDWFALQCLALRCISRLRTTIIPKLKKLTLLLLVFFFFLLEMLNWL